ncbi:MAG: cbiP [Chloroflexi bacterium]|nr:cbiP [Chloroflexota bacterium]
MTGRALMIQGTSSHVGKSVLVAGLCRLFQQDGFRVAPFKAQNMALNSFATPDGREIGRAQAAQAEAARVTPTVQMNPILLKPEGNSRSQVVVLGRPEGVMDAAQYERRKEALWPIVLDSLRTLLDAYDIVVIEGAGSPVEMNLKLHDIVNMRVAHAANAPVLLVADIDRGGVFASLVGTMALLDDAERARVAGFVVNKFRGDVTLFQPGIAFIEERLERPVIGVVPWIDRLGIAEEDSLGLPGSAVRTYGEGTVEAHDSHANEKSIDVVVIRLPRISNFDDFDSLRNRPGVGLRFVDSEEAFGNPALVILPGTKTTRADLAFLRQRNLDRAIMAHAERGGAVLGICGGYQMLGERIEDPDGVEGPAGVDDGLGLLPAITRFAGEKTTIQVQGRAVGGGLFTHCGETRFDAYEIHMGQTTCNAPAAFAVREREGLERLDGARSADGNIVGTYLHGLLRDGRVADALISHLAERQGIAISPAIDADDPYDRLASTLRESVDVDHIRRLIETTQR